MKKYRSKSVHMEFICQTLPPPKHIEQSHVKYVQPNKNNNKLL